MIEYRTGDLMSVKEGVIIHGCNAQGVMGSGVARLVREMYPIAFEEYHKFCIEAVDRILGRVLCVHVSHDLVIANAITQDSYGTHQRQANYGAIAAVFRDLNAYYNDDVVFNIPKIGAGLGGGDWDVISEIIEFNCPTRKVICWTL